MARKIWGSGKRAMLGAKSMRAMKAMENLEAAQKKARERNAGHEAAVDLAIKNLRATEAWIESKKAQRERAEEVLEGLMRRVSKRSRLIDVPLNAGPERIRLIALEAAQRHALGRKQKTVVRLLTVIQNCKTQRKELLAAAEAQKKAMAKRLES